MATPKLDTDRIQAAARALLDNKVKAVRVLAHARQAREDARAALEQIDEDDQRAAARALVNKKLRSMRGLDRQVATRRLAGMLARKGYAAGLAFSVVREALGEAEDGDEPHPDF